MGKNGASLPNCSAFNFRKNYHKFCETSDYCLLLNMDDCWVKMGWRFSCLASPAICCSAVLFFLIISCKNALSELKIVAISIIDDFMLFQNFQLKIKCNRQEIVYFGAILAISPLFLPDRLIPYYSVRRPVQLIFSIIFPNCATIKEFLCYTHYNSFIFLPF